MASFGKSLKKGWDSTKKAAKDAKQKFDERLTMEGLLTQARISLEHYLDNKLIPAESRMSQDVLQKAKGIAFITEAKGGFIVGVKGGSGVILVKNASTKKASKLMKIGKKKKSKNIAWSAPCAVGTGGLSVGFLAGAAKVDHIIILTSQAQVDMFLSKGQLQIKGNANATAAKWGRNADAGIGVGSNKSSESGKQAIAPIFTYSFGNKGIYGGISLDGEVLAVRKECNHVFYGGTVVCKDILTGVIKIPKKNKDYNELTKLLNDYATCANDESKSKSVRSKVGGDESKSNDANDEAMRAMAQNKDVQNAGKAAMQDKNVRNAAFNAYSSGGNDPNANRKLAKSLAKNKAVQGAAVSVAKDEKVQKAAWQSAKKNANKKNFGKAKKIMMPKAAKPKTASDYNKVTTPDYV